MVDNIDPVAALHLSISILIITSGHLWPMGSTMVMIIAGRLQQIQEAKIIPTWDGKYYGYGYIYHPQRLNHVFFWHRHLQKFKCYNHRQSHPLFSFSSPSQPHRLLTLIIIMMRLLRVSFFNIMMRFLRVILMQLTVLVNTFKATTQESASPRIGHEVATVMGTYSCLVKKFKHCARTYMFTQPRDIHSFQKLMGPNFQPLAIAHIII